MNSHTCSFFARLDRSRGFTFVELLVGLTAMMIVVAGSLSGMLFVMRREAVLSERMHLMTDGQTIASFLRTTTRLTSADQMVMYPEKAPHTAISYPVPQDWENSTEDVLEDDGRLIWGETLIIHAWPPDDPEELRLTRFRPRDNTLDAEQRLTQLTTVAKNGNGNNTHNSVNSTTRTLSTMKPEFSFRKESRSYNFYSSTPTRDPRAVLGGVRLKTGANTLRFTTTDRSPGSSGYHVILDKLRVSPAGLPIEAEALLPVKAQSGASAQVEELVAGNWSDRRAVNFPATRLGDWVEFEFYNDTWHETLFLRNGLDFEHAVTEMYTEAGNVGTRLRPEGRDLAWISSFQMESEGYGVDDDFFEDAVVRVIVRGSNAAQGGGHIMADGDGCTVVFRATSEPGKQFYIKDAFISMAADEYYPTPTILADTTKRLQFGSPDSPRDYARLNPGETERTIPINFPINSLKSYVISYRIGNADHESIPPGNPWVWGDGSAETTDTYYIPGDSNPSEWDAQVGSWSGRTDVQSLKKIVGVEEIKTTYYNEATYTTRIIDTTLENPNYKDLYWDGEVPTAEADMEIRVRAGDQPDLSDASEWEEVSAISSEGPLSLGAGRYLQVQVKLFRDIKYDLAPALRSFTLRWPGPAKYVDIGGVMLRDSDGGIAEVSVNGDPPASSLRAELKIQSQKTLGAESGEIWNIMAETMPRN